MIDTPLFTYLALPFLIFLARMTDVSMGTIRTLLIYRGKRLIVFCLGFIEIVVWVFAISNVLKHLDNFLNIVAFAGGFATGNLVGMILEEKLVFGRLLIRVFAVGDPAVLIRSFKESGYGATTVDAQGLSGAPVKLVYSIVNRQDLKKLTAKILAYNPKAFYTVEDIRAAKEGTFPLTRPRSFGILPSFLYSKKKK